MLIEFYYHNEYILEVPSVYLCPLTLEEAKTIDSLLILVIRDFVSIKIPSEDH